MAHELFFMDRLQQALQAKDRTAALTQALAEIQQQSRQEMDRVGRQNWSCFIKEICQQAQRLQENDFL